MGFLSTLGHIAAYANPLTLGTSLVAGQFAAGHGSSLVNGIKHLGDEDKTATDKRNALNGVGANSNAFAQQLQQYAAGLNAEGIQNRAGLQATANGQNSISAEQLRQGLQQNLATQRSMAAGASPQNAGLAARSAAMAGGRSATALSGQQAVAGLAERQQAQQALAQSIASAYGANVNGANGAYGNAVGAYGGTTPDKSWLDKWSGPIAAGMSVAAKG